MHLRKVRSLSHTSSCSGAWHPHVTVDFCLDRAQVGRRHLLGPSQRKGTPQEGCGRPSVFVAGVWADAVACVRLDGLLSPLSHSAFLFVGLRNGLGAKRGCGRSLPPWAGPIPGSLR